MKTFSLFSGRHELPENLGPICESFDFVNKQANKSDLYNEAVTYNGTVKLYVTGLTPALTEFLAQRMKGNNSTILLHFDNSTNTYWEQSL